MEFKNELTENQYLKPYENWTKPTLSRENGELIRVVETFYDRYFLQDHSQALFDIIGENYNKTEPEILTDEIWAKLDNTDSWDIIPGDHTEVEKIISERRDWKTLKEGFDKNKSMDMPIVARMPDNQYHLISGNTRLCVARASGYRPKVVIINFPDAII